MTSRNSLVPRGSPALLELERRKHMAIVSGQTPGGQQHGSGVVTPAQELTYVFPYQSFFSNSLQEQAILEQPLATPQVSQQVSQLSGYALGLAPWSETPLAVIFNGGANGQRNTSSVLHIKPGQIIRPQGEGADSKGAFSGFSYGLPFGWLGGGLACLYVFQTSDAYALWPGDPEIVYHRLRMQILSAPAAISSAAGASYNWPGRFPWLNAISQTANKQGNAPAITITRPTRTVLRLRDSVNTDAMYAQFRGTNPLDIGADGLTPTTTDTTGAIQISWPSLSSAATGVASFPVLVQDGDGLNRLNGDYCRLDFIGKTGSPIINDYVDVVRYGAL